MVRPLLRILFAAETVLPTRAVAEGAAGIVLLLVLFLTMVAMAAPAS
jgi:hypothetical protein